MFGSAYISTGTITPRLDGKTTLDRIGATPQCSSSALEWLVVRCGITQPRADRRLNTIEISLAALARRWRAPVAIVPTRELRMAGITCEGLLPWVEGEACAESDAVNRLATYVSGALIDETVPVGWMRLYLGCAPGAILTGCILERRSKQEVAPPYFPDALKRIRSSAGGVQ
jgi:hypothetical protein